MAEIVKALLAATRVHNASDLFITENEVARARIDGQVLLLGEDDDKLSRKDLVTFWKECGGDPDKDLDRDASYLDQDGQRYRVNLHKRLGELAAVLRPIKTDIPTMDDLGLPPELLKTWMNHSSGVVLVTGATGSGKSTTVAACLDWINRNKTKHVVTIEDPIEYLFESKKALFTQREVHTDTDSFAKGLRSSLRQSPDVILLGEIRDAVTGKIGLQAAETGHLVVATLHSSSVSDTIDRITNLFPAEDRENSLHLLSQQLIGIISQKLLPRAGGGLFLAYEHLQNFGATRDWIAQGDFNSLADFMLRDESDTTLTFLDCLVHACQQGIIEQSVAEEACGNPTEFHRALRGIR